MKHYIYIKGKEVVFDVFGRICKETPIEGLTVVNDFIYSRLQKGEKICHFGGAYEPIVIGNGYTFHHTKVHEIVWHDMTPTEKRKFNKVLKENNLCFKTYTLKRVSPLGYNSYTTKSEALYWADTDKMPVSVNGTVMTCKEFRELAFSDNMKVVNSWDNGYSHWGEKTNKIETIYRLLDNICAEKTDNGDDTINTTWKGGKVHCGECWTWQFDGRGVLQIRLTEKEINWSQTSNT